MHATYALLLRCMKARWYFFFSVAVVACEKEPLTTLRSASDDRTAAELVINEAAPRGTEGEDGIASDWIELKAGDGGLVIGEEEWFLSDDPRDPLRFALPAMELGANTTLLLYCDEGEDDALHTGFKLSSAGEHITLVHRVGERSVLIDAVDLLPMEHGHATQGRAMDSMSGWVLLKEATPGAPNSAAMEADKEYE